MVTTMVSVIIPKLINALISFHFEIEGSSSASTQPLEQQASSEQPAPSPSTASSIQQTLPPSGGDDEG
jgi:hypothetical protein